MLTLIGHGSYDGVQYKFNLVGAGHIGRGIARRCATASPAKRQLIVNTTSASGGSIAALKRPGRAVISATKSGTEKNATVFARYWLQALQDPTTDVDKNEAISALEAYQLRRSTKTAGVLYVKVRNAWRPSIAQFEDTGKNEPVRAASTSSGEGLLLSSFMLVRLGSDAQQAAGSIRPSTARCSSRRKILNARLTCSSTRRPR